MGKLIGGPEEQIRQFLREIAGRAGLAISFEIDPHDEAVLLESADLCGEGISFSLYSAVGDTDIVRAWNEARFSSAEALLRDMTSARTSTIQTNQQPLRPLPTQSVA
jgi:hypothetical protein